MVAPAGMDRVRGRVRGDRDGPTLLCIGGLHGNEPAGVVAMERVLTELNRRARDMSGEFVAMVGNLEALAHGVRFMDRDLNRAWTPERLDRLRGADRSGWDREDREQVELLEAIEQVVESARGPVYVLDLHTTSGEGGPFSTFGDTLPNRAFAGHFPVPMILGLEELVSGTLLAFLGHHGLIAVAFESGQHEEEMAVDRAEAAIWIGVTVTGLLSEARTPEVVEARRILRRSSKGLPRAMEMRYRHELNGHGGFRMNPGYRNFQPVWSGEPLASDAGGSITAREASRILMPLYQEQGDDGFFLVKEFKPFWLHASYVLRRLRADRAARWLPGVRRDPTDAEAVVVDKRVARWFARQLFHLLGFRRIEDAGDRLVMRRREFDSVGAGRDLPRAERLIP